MLHLGKNSLQQFLIKQVHSIREQSMLPMGELEEGRLLGCHLDCNQPMVLQFMRENPIDVLLRLPKEELVEQRLLGFLLNRIQTNRLPILEIKLKPKQDEQSMLPMGVLVVVHLLGCQLGCNQPMELQFMRENPIDVLLRLPKEELVKQRLQGFLLNRIQTNRLPILEIKLRPKQDGQSMLPMGVLVVVQLLGCQ
jgi:hypothetical protein